MVRFWGVFSWNGQLQGIRWESGGSLNSANSFLVWNCHEILMEDCIVGKPRKRKSPTDVACDAISGPSNGDYGLKKVFVSDYVGKWQLWFLFILRSLRLTETQPKHNRPQICWPLGMWMQMTSEIYYLYQMYLIFSVLVQATVDRSLKDLLNKWSQPQCLSTGAFHGFSVNQLTEN